MNKIDEKSVKLVQELVRQLGYEVTPTEWDKDPIDLEGDDCWVEVKERKVNFEGYKWGVSIEMLKFGWIRDRYRNATKKPTQLWVIELWADGIITLSDLRKHTYIQTGWAPATTAFSNRQLVKKEFIHFDVEKKFDRETL